jgi:hypothetical protein
VAKVPRLVRPTEPVNGFRETAAGSRVDQKWKCSCPVGPTKRPLSRGERVQDFDDKSNRFRGRNFPGGCETCHRNGVGAQRVDSVETLQKAVGHRSSSFGREIYPGDGKVKSSESQSRRALIPPLGTTHRFEGIEITVEEFLHTAMIDSPPWLCKRSA